MQQAGLFIIRILFSLQLRSLLSDIQFHWIGRICNFVQLVHGDES